MPRADENDAFLQMATRGNGKRPQVNSEIQFALIADQDLKASEGVPTGEFRSYFKTFRLKYLGDRGTKSYQFTCVHELEVRTPEGVGQPGEERGGEYSTMEYWDKKFLVICDKTGNVDELVPEKESDLVNTQWYRRPLIGKNGEVVVSQRPSSNDSLKVEWSTIRDGMLIVGSHGNTNGTRSIVTMRPRTYEMKSNDGKNLYDRLKAKTGCQRGYLTHESCRWSQEHQKFFFIPRKLSKVPFDEESDEKAPTNIMLATSDLTGEAQIDCRPYDLKAGRRGCSEFLFIPDTADCHILLVRTEERRRGPKEYDDLHTYLSVIDLAGNVLMEETSCGSDRKFEGATWLGAFKQRSWFQSFRRTLPEWTAPVAEKRRMPLEETTSAAKKRRAQH